MKKLLFEYGKWEEVNNSDTLRKAAEYIWDSRISNNYTPINSEKHTNKKNWQPFLKFQDGKIRANNYVGFIQTEDDLVEIYPKVFRNQPQDKKGMLQQIFFWFGYCRNWKFPFNQAQLDNAEIEEFPELIIYLIAKQFLEVLSNQPLSMYQQTEEAMISPKGSINFKRYITNSLARGNFQNVECDYEPFLFDNKVNRVIKYCSRLLINKTKFADTQHLLQEVIFILDEVEDVPCSGYDVENINLNPFFEEYHQVLNSCKLILSQQLYSNEDYNLSQWSLLFPMEYIFEDFVAGFLAYHFSKDWKIDYQKSDMYLANYELAGKKQGVFNMQHDIFLTSKRNPNRQIIIDTKYKLRPNDFKQDPKKGIEQADLYQMTSYAFRRGCSEVILIYPNLSENIHKADEFEIISGFNSENKIKVTAIEIPFWTEKKPFDREELEKNLKTSLSAALKNI